MLQLSLSVKMFFELLSPQCGVCIGYTLHGGNSLSPSHPWDASVLSVWVFVWEVFHIAVYYFSSVSGRNRLGYLNWLVRWRTMGNNTAEQAKCVWLEFSGKHREDLMDSGKELYPDKPNTHIVKNEWESKKEFIYIKTLCDLVTKLMGFTSFSLCISIK